ncbi:MAG TPA: hypothetical protein VKI65_06600, partial [Gemmataceae bacterium]|nr:hypothetical protein [Gemmataceae bacterium]
LFTELHLPHDRAQELQLFEEVLAEQRRRDELAARQAEETARARREQEVRQREAIARDESRRLKTKYGVDWYEDDSPLYPILLDLEGGRELSDSDETWLNRNRLFPVLAFHYERVGLLARAGSYWRKAQNPERALRITDNERVQNNSPVLTMRGGAFRDLNDLDSAERCGFSAIKLSPEDYHPYNLLGAVYYQRGLPEQGDQYFQMAVALGSEEEDESIQSALEKAAADEKKRVAEHLLKRDAARFAWARSHL